MHIFLHELKAYSKSILIWTLALIAVITFFFSMFPYIHQEAEDFKKLLEGFPEALRMAIGLSVDSISSVLGFYSYVFL